MAENAENHVGIAESCGNAPPAVEEEESSIDFVALFRKLRGGKKTIFRVTLGCFAIATLIAFVLPFQYTSAVSFIPPNLNGSSSMASALADRKSTRLNSSHANISYAVLCLQKKTTFHLVVWPLLCVPGCPSSTPRCHGP